MSDRAEVITGQDIVGALRRAAARLISLRDHLNRLDADVGDGDSGLTAERGAQAVLAYLDATPPGHDLGRWLAGAGMAYNRAAPSTMGALMATAFMRAGKEVMGRGTLGPDDLAGMLNAADQGLQERAQVERRPHGMGQPVEREVRQPPGGPAHPQHRPPDGRHPVQHAVHR